MYLPLQYTYVYACQLIDIFLRVPVEQSTLAILRDKGVMEMKPFTFHIINQLFLFTLSMITFKITINIHQKSAKKT